MLFFKASVDNQTWYMSKRYDHFYVVFKPFYIISTEKVSVRISLASNNESCDSTRTAKWGRPLATNSSARRGVFEGRRWAMKENTELPPTDGLTRRGGSGELISGFNWLPRCRDCRQDVLVLFDFVDLFGFINDRRWLLISVVSR